MNHGAHNEPNDEGTITVLYAVVFIAFLMMLGLVVDGGRLLDARSHAQDLAGKAARAGAQELSVTTFTSTGTVTLDADRARQAANRYLTRAGATGQITITGETVTVTVTDTVALTWLRLAGLSSRTVSGVATADARTA